MECSSTSSLEPRVDMEFDSHEAAYQFYREYAKSVGFGTAKLSSRRSRASKEFIDAKFTCTRYGSKQQSDDAVNPRPSPKIDCKASLHVKRRPHGKWYIHSFVKEHNHELLPGQSHFFRSHRSIDPLKNDSKVRRRKLVATVSKPLASYQLAGPLDGLIRNQHDRGRSLTLEGGDAQLLLELFVHMQEENPKFFYAIDLNEDNKLRNVFWVDTKGVDDYTFFSDAVLFDTTFFASEYKIPLVFFIGANHHIQPVLLGCALIADDTVFTYAWVMQTWCLAMGGRSPQVLLTDQNNAIKAVVSAVFPRTGHYYALWHVLDSIPKKLQHLNFWQETFMSKFQKCIHRSYSEDQFEKRWWKLVERFNLREDQWMQSLYQERKKWVPTFLKDVCFSGLSVASRSESLSSFMDKYVAKETSLREFIGQYKSVLEDRYEEEAKSKFDAWHETPEMKSPSPFEKQMFLVYTHEIFRKFQVEVLGAAACHLKKEKEDGQTVTYAVKDFEVSEDFMVEWNEQKPLLSCSCSCFQYKGYLCRHAIVVLQMSGVFSIPFRYVLQRWTNAATSRHCITERLDEVQSRIRRYNDLCRRAIILAEEGSLSGESYKIAIGAIKEASRQAATVNNSADSKSRPTTLETPATRTADQSNQCKNPLTVDYGPVHSVMQSSYSAKEKESNCARNDKGKVQLEPEVPSVGLYTDFHQLDIHGSLECSLYPRFLTTLLRSGEMSKKGVEMLGEMLEED